MKYYIVTDIANHPGELRNVLEKEGFEKDNPEHVVVSLGNAISKNREDIEFLTGLKANRAFLVLGNVEANISSLCEKGYLEANEKETVETLCSIYDIDSNSKTAKLEVISLFSEDELFKKYFELAEYFFETLNFVFIHGWIPCKAIDTAMGNIYLKKENWRNSEKWEFRESTTYDGKKICEDFGIKERNRTIVCSGKKKDESPFITNEIVQINDTKELQCFVLEGE